MTLVVYCGKMAPHEVVATAMAANADKDGKRVNMRVLPCWARGGNHELPRLSNRRAALVVGMALSDRDQRATDGSQLVRSWQYGGADPL